QLGRRQERHREYGTSLVLLTATIHVLPHVLGTQRRRRPHRRGASGSPEANPERLRAEIVSVHDGLPRQLGIGQVVGTAQRRLLAAQEVLPRRGLLLEGGGAKPGPSLVVDALGKECAQQNLGLIGGGLGIRIDFLGQAGERLFRRPRRQDPPHGGPGVGRRGQQIPPPP